MADWRQDAAVTGRRDARRYRRARLPCEYDAWSGLSEDAFDDVAVDVGEAEVAALETEGELLMVDAKEVKHRGVEVEDSHRVFHGGVAEFIRGA